MKRRMYDRSTIGLGALLLTLLALMAYPRIARGQADTTSLAMLTRIAAAIDGHRTGELLYVAISRSEPHRVAIVTPSRDTAIARARALAGYVVRGPFQATMDFGKRPVFIDFDDLCHDDDSGDICFPPVADMPPLLYFEEIDSLRVTAFHGPESRARTLRGNTDALFFTVSAADKFFFPYLARIYGTDYATRKRDSLGAVIRRTPVRPAPVGRPR